MDDLPWPDRPPDRGKPLRVSAWLPRLAAVAAVLLVGLVLFWPGGRTFATPREAVEAAYRTHIDDEEADRHYRLAVELPSRFPGLKDHEADLWTGGDRFRIEPGPGGGVWGQDDDGRVWIAPAPDAGAVFEAMEVPGPLREALLVRAVRLPDLLTELLGTCDLALVRGGPRGTERIEATAKDDERTLRRGVLDIDTRTRAVRSLEVRRRLPGGEVAVARLTFVSSGRNPKAFYDLRRALEVDGEVFDHTRPGPRLMLLARHGLGQLVEKNP